MIKMIFMDYLYDLPNATTGIDDITVQTISAVPSFSTLIILFIMGVVFLGGVSRQATRTGTADYPAWAVISSISGLLGVLILGIYSGLVSLTTTVIVTVITIFSGVWLFLDRRISEV